MAIRPESAPVYEAAHAWGSTSLILGDSIFSGEGLWVPEHIGRLNAAFVENLLTDERSFLDKLKQQLEPTPPEVKRLAAEMLWLMMLFPSNVSVEAKLRLVQTVYEWSGARLPLEHSAIRALAAGVGSTGQAYNQHRWRELTMLIRAMGAFNELPQHQQTFLVTDGWRFAEWLDRTPDAKNRQIRNILLHLLFPAEFERVSSFGHKRRIVRHFAPMFGITLPRESVSLPVDAFDRPLEEIRRHLEERHSGRPIDFYDAEIEAQWRPISTEKPWKSGADGGIDIRLSDDPNALEKRLGPGLREVVRGHAFLSASILRLRRQPTLGLMVSALARCLAKNRRDSAWALWEILERETQPPGFGDLSALFELPPDILAQLEHPGVEALHIEVLLHTPFGDQVLPILERADDCAREVSGEAAPELSIRHLIGAILRPGGMNEAKQALEARGYRLDRLRAGVMEFFQETLVTDDLPAWREYLQVPLPAPQLPRPGFARDYIDPDAKALEADHLQVDADVQALARLLCAESVEPPLSVGLFADWGTGKSTFMQRLKWNIGVLSDRAAKAKKRNVGTAYQDGVVSIWFNAWHYMDANLWASLVTHIFEQLARHLSGDPHDNALEETRKRLYERLAASQGLLAEAKRREAVAIAERDAADERVRIVQRQQESVTRRIALARDVAAGMWKEIDTGAAKPADDEKPADDAKPSDGASASKQAASADGGAKPADSAAVSGPVNSVDAVGPVSSADAAAKPVGSGAAGGLVNSADGGIAGPMNSADGEAKPKDAVDPEAAKAVDETLAKLAKDVRTSVTTAAEQLGLPADRASIAEIRGTLAQMRGMWGNLAASAEILSRQRAFFRGLVRPLLISLLLAVVVVGALWAFDLNLREWARWATGLIIALAPFISILAASAAKVRRVLERADAEIQASTKRAEAEAEGLQRDLDALKQAEAQAQRDKVQAEQQVKQIESEIEDIRAGRRLEQFIRDRAGSDDYRRHLGIIATIRQDFEALQRLLDEVRRESETPPQPPEGTQAAAPARPAPAVRRIVLYIDDLDRCPEDRVVEVLQAVHLLLAFPLFVVVVGVDPRWLLRAVQSQYDRLLASDREATQAGLPADDVLHWASTPQNYLEKIFQIPFTLEPMNPEGFGRLLGSLIKVRAPAASPPPPTGTTSAPGPGPGDDAGATDGLAGTQPAGLDEQWLDDDSVEETEHEAGTDEDAGLDPPGLEVEAWELAYLGGLAPLIGSPRMAKRFANVYRFIRASLAGEKLDAFSGTAQAPGEFRAVGLLLALLTGFPGEAVELFRRLLADDPVPDEGWPEFVRRVAQDPDATHPASKAGTLPARRWERMRLALEQVQESVGVEWKMEPYRTWAPRVARFSFQTGQILARRPTA